MTIKFRSRPLTAAETAAGWEAVLVADVPQMKHLAHADDVATWADSSPMAATMGRVLGAIIVVEA
jgi:hypothetical protein